MKKVGFKMKNETKKDFEDSIKTLLIVVFSVLFVVSMNKKCSNLTQKAISAKIEKMEIEKKRIMDLQKVR